MIDPLSDEPSGLRFSALEAIHDGDPFAALEIYRQAIEKGASDPATLAHYGVLLWRVYDFGQAETIFSTICGHADATPQLLKRIAHCYFEVGRFAQAASVMRLAVSRWQRPSAELLNTLAWSLERDHQTDAAREFAAEALHRDPSYGPAVRLLAHIDRRNGDFESAIQSLSEHLQQYPGDFDWGLRYELAAVLDRTGEFNPAWENLSLAKSQLTARASGHLQESYRIRRRQWELSQAVTEVDLRRWNAMRGELGIARRLCLLTGFPRSGTTLLEQILAANSDAADTDESGILPSQFIRPLVWNAEDTATSIVELRGFEAAQIRAGRETYFDLTDRYLGHAVGSKLLVEKDPLLTADLPIPLRLFPEAKILVALRDPRDVMISYLFTIVPLNWSSSPSLDPIEASRFYCDTMRHWLLWRPRLAGRWCELHYERMIRNVEPETQRIADFLGLSWNSSMVDDRRRAQQKAVRTPTYDDVTKPLYTRSIARWRHYESHLTPALKLLEPFIEAFGYDAT